MPAQLVLLVDAGIHAGFLVVLLDVVLLGHVVHAHVVAGARRRA